MRSLAAILCLVLTAALTSACTQYRVSVVPRFATCEAQGIGVGTTDGNTFVQKKAFFLSPSFNPQGTDPNTFPPSGPNLYKYQPYSDDLAAAYNAAPLFFKEDLCGLDGLFIIQNACANPKNCTPLDVTNYSWGFREHPPQISQGTTPGRYIATSQQLWQGGQAPIFSSYQTQRLQQLLNWTVASTKPPVYQTATPNTTTMSVLASLAHEFGHLYWWDLFVTTPGGPVDPDNFCNGQYYSNSWQYPVGVPSNRWITFGELSDTNNHLQYDINMGKLFEYLNGQDYGDAGDLVWGIHSGTWPGSHAPKEPNVQNGRWASELAPFSPDEDFVETFELYVLRNASPPLTSLPIIISGTKTWMDDIPANLPNKPELVRKIGCFQSISR